MALLFVQRLSGLQPYLVELDRNFGVQGLLPAGQWRRALGPAQVLVEKLQRVPVDDFARAADATDPVTPV